MERSLWKSKMARRLMFTFSLMVAVPLACTVLFLGHIGREQIVWTVHTMEGINGSTVKEASRAFRQMEDNSIQKHDRQYQAITANAIRGMSDKIAKEQSASLSETARDLSRLTRDNFDTAMRQSLETNKGTLESVTSTMKSLFARSAQDARAKASGNVEKAMLTLNDTLMQERATLLAQTVSEHISDAISFLVLAAQVPCMSSGDVGGQKATLDSMMRRYPQFRRLTVLDTAGRETAKSDADVAVTVTDLGAHPTAAFFTTAIHDRNYLAPDDRHTDGGAPSLQIAVPIEIYRGKAVAVLEARLSLDELWDAIRAARVGRQGFAYVLDQSGKTVLAPRRSLEGAIHCAVPLTPLHGTMETLPWRVAVAIPREEVMRPIQALNRAIALNAQRSQQEAAVRIQEATKGAAGLLQTNAMRVRNNTTQRMQVRSQDIFRLLTTETRSQTQKMQDQMQKALAVQQNAIYKENDVQIKEAASMASAQLTRHVQPLTANALVRADKRLSLFAMGILALSCVVCCGLALWMAGKIVRPVARLAYVSQAIADGKLDKRVDENAPDEIGDLAKAFNRMAVSLQQSRNELREAESQLVQSAKLASLGTLSAGVAHELNQPVAVIRGVSQQLRDEKDLPEEMKADLELIEGQTDRMMKIIKHLRTFCRSGGAEYTEVDVNTVIEDCFILIGAQLKAHDIEVCLELSEQALFVLGDANELEQVFLNLITNAGDALSGRRDARITIRTRFENGQADIRFSDNGTGIPEHVLPRIFDPFFTTKEAGQGTGLGLSISHTILQKHQGNIRASGCDGAVFDITLPILYKENCERRNAA